MTTETKDSNATPTGDIFEETTQTTQQGSGDDLSTTTTTDQGVLEALVGPGKKFATVEDLAKGKANSDEYIKKLEEETEELRKELTKALENGETNATIADIVKALRDKEDTASKEGGDNQTARTDEELQEMVKSILKGETQAATAKANRELGNKLVLQKVGGDIDAAKSYVAERAKRLGLTPSKLAELSEESPDAFATLMDVRPSTSSGSVAGLRDGHATATSPHGGPRMEIDGYHTKAYFDAKRKELGNAKYIADRKLQSEYMRSALKLGEKFDTN